VVKVVVVLPLKNTLQVASRINPVFERFEIIFTAKTMLLYLKGQF